MFFAKTILSSIWKSEAEGVIFINWKLFKLHVTLFQHQRNPFSLRKRLNLL